MHLVVERAELQPVLILDHHSFKPCVGRGGRQRIVLQMKQNMDGVRCDDQVDQNRSEKDQVFDRVHRQARPWSHVNVAMVQRMDMFIQKRDVERAVNPVKIKALPDRDQKEQCDEPNLSLPI